MGTLHVVILLVLALFVERPAVLAVEAAYIRPSL
jgi:hypothetical protein